MQDEPTKVCTKCKQAKPLDDFYRDRSTKSGRHSRCKPCSHAGVAAWGRRNPERARALRRRIKAERRAFLDALKPGPCVDCGGMFPPYVYDFDHVKGEKLFRIADWVPNGGPTKEEVIAEVAKCEIRCSNCHRMRHWEKYRPNEKAA